MAPIPAQEPVFRSPELVADNIFASRLILETLRLDAVNLNGDQIDEISVFEKRRLTTFVLRGGDYETQQFDFGQATGIAWGDLDDDGDVDAVVAIVRPTFEVVLLANDGEGRLTRQSLPFVFDERFPNDIRLGDLDGDQRLDVITQPGNLLGEPTRGTEPWSEAPFGFSLVVHGQVESHYDRITLRESRTPLGASFFRLTVSESE